MEMRGIDPLQQSESNCGRQPTPRPTTSSATMFAKRLLHKAVLHHPNHKLQHGGLQGSELDLRIVIHYGIPSTASVLAFDPIQRLLAIGTLDGRLKVIGGDNIEGLLVSPKQFPYKYLEFLQNQGHLVGVLNDNDIQVWNLESRSLVCSLQWESDITAFSVISGSHFIYVGDQHGLFSVIKFEAEEGQLLKSSYNLSAKFLREAAGFSDPSEQPIVGVLLQPSSSGNRHDISSSYIILALLFSLLLIAFEDGLLILWDVSEARIVFLGGGKDLQLKDEDGNSTETGANPPDIEQNLGDKEITALCWASSSGSILAVGYLDGDILLWNLSSAAPSKGQQTSSKNVVKLQLSTAERRLPVIVLQWSNSYKSPSDSTGQLFVYGGDEIGSEEVLTVLTLEWLSGMDSVRCTNRADLTLSGSFADLILLPGPGTMGLSSKDELFVLTNPGQLHLYDNDSLSTLTSQQKRMPAVSAMEFPVLVPMVDPSLTVAKLIRLPSKSNSSKILAEVASALRTGSGPGLARSNWPLTGGVPSQLSTVKSAEVERVYFVGYSNGSVLVCDATHAVLSYICYIEGEVNGINVAGSDAQVTKLDFCSISLRLAVGNECGLVRIYDFKGHSDGQNFHFVTETKSEVHDAPQGKGPHCSAVFSLLGSSVQALSFANSGTKLAIGFLSGRVVCNMTSLSVLFLIDGVPSSSSPITSMVWKQEACFQSDVNSLKQSETDSGNSLEEILFVLSRDGKINILNGDSGKIISSQPLHVKESTSISMQVQVSSRRQHIFSFIELGILEILTDFCTPDGSISTSEASNDKLQEELVKNTTDASPDEKEEPLSTRVNASEADLSSSETSHSGDLLLDPLVLLCCENSLRLFSAKSLIQGHKKPIQKVKHSKSCSWTTIFKKDDKVYGLLSLLQTGTFEIRSLPDLELVAESSLLSILRWNYKVNMDKIMCSDDYGQIVLANGSELAFISLLAGENEFSNPEHLPCLHDKVLAAAADAAYRFSTNQKKKQTTVPGILGGIVKGIKGGKNSPTNVTKIPTSNFGHLEDIFFKPPLPDSHPTVAVTDNEELELDIDDIEIDEPNRPITKASTSSPDVKNKQKDKLQQDREKLFEGGTNTDDIKPRLRTPEEIMATYRKTGDASSVAAHARNKLMERQEKLERISQRTAELQSGAEDFASLANELVKTMERRKWWQI
ncbi:Syntaxin-binding protein 5, partial [Mucuna pruriens]